MDHHDVFNGDADGLCALQQLRLNEPRPRALPHTGSKRDICLLDQLLDVRDSCVTVLDISLAANRVALLRLLGQGNRVEYVDHHFAGDIPSHPGLTCHIDPSPDCCTSSIVDRLLRGRHRAWAVVGAFGDNLTETALELAATLNLRATDCDRLQELGVLLNYNAYGESLADLLVAPLELYRAMALYSDPLQFWARDHLVPLLRAGYQADLQQAQALVPIVETTAVRVYQLPAAAWARRVSGPFAHFLNRQRVDQAHAVLSPLADGSLRVSVRAPRSRPVGADAFCRRYPGGGGRSAAAGINALPHEHLSGFLNDFCRSFAYNAS